MIKANELRVGNCILIDDTNWGKVISIEENRFATENTYNIYTDGTSGDYWKYDTDFVAGIPLTPEILEKCGFVKELGKIDIFIQGRLRLWLGVRGETLCYLVEEDTTTGHFIPNGIAYLHQLQNIYFALTGEELKVNLNEPATVN